MASDDETDTLIVELDAELKRKFAAIAARKGTTLKAIVTDLLEDYVDDHDT